MTSVQQKPLNIKQPSQPLKTQQSKQFNNKQQSQKQPTHDLKILMIAFLIGFILSIASQKYIGQNWQQLSSHIFSINTITEQLQKLTVLKESMIIMATFQFIIAMIIMSIRILGQKISPVGQKDSFIIVLLNRILNNNIEQALVFFSLYSYVLLSPQINLSNEYVFGLPLLFLIGRFLFFLSYVLGSLLNASTFRSWGFIIGFAANYLIVVEIILNKTTFMRTFLFA